MWKLVSLLFLAGTVSAWSVESANACGGGCGSSGGGRGDRTAASRKVLSGGPSLAQAGPRTARPGSSQPASNVVLKTSPVRTVAAQGKSKPAASSQIYSCPMHPQIQWTKPTDCPICGMKLKPKPKKAPAAKRGAAASADHEGMAMEGPSSGSDAMSDMPGMGGMDEMMMCPGCMMNMGGKEGMGRGEQAQPASQKASGGARRGMAGMGCGC